MNMSTGYNLVHIPPVNTKIAAELLSCNMHNAFRSYNNYSLVNKTGCLSINPLTFLRRFPGTKRFSFKTIYLFLIAVSSFLNKLLGFVIFVNHIIYVYWLLLEVSVGKDVKSTSPSFQF